MKYLGEAVGKVCGQEHKALLVQGWDHLKGTKHTWFANPWDMSARQWREFKVLRKSALKTARAWLIKELG